MAITNLTGQKTSKTFKNLMQISSSGQIFDGLGNLVTYLDLATNIETGSFATTGSNTFINNQIVSGSLTVTQGISGSFSGSGANLYNIPAAAIVGLNLSQISSGSVSASISPNSGLEINTNVTATSFTGSLQGTVTNAETASYAPSYVLTSSTSSMSVLSSSYTQTASYAANYVPLSSTSSMLAPYVLTSSTSSMSVLSSSYAQTASYAPSYLPLTGGTIAGSLVIQNNLTVLGSASIQYISESVLNIGTNTITVNTLTPSVRFGGLSVIDSGSSPAVSASLLYDSLQDEFIFVHKGTSTSAITSSHFVLGPETYNNLGDEIYLSQNRIPKSVGNEHLNDSNITDSGTIVSINSNTQVTGSLTVTQGISGSFSGSGANLFNIPATGITGLNLSQISSGSVSASISPNNGLQVNTNVTATSFSGSFSGSGANLFNIPASGITGLNLSQITSGSVSASISPNNGLEVNTNVTATSFTGSLQGTASNSISASYAISSSYTLSSSYSDTSISASYAISSSYATTASYAANAGMDDLDYLLVTSFRTLYNY